ncbi:unnamed protein product [Dicrocoelium dendriticum]|nr:unnamed protein product [Dicrocoelium dendriticum]
MESQSYGYHSNNGNIYHGAQDLTMSAPTFGEADVIGCGVNFVTNCLFFTKNGIFLGPINAGKKLPQPVYPCVAMSFPKCHLSVNFGHHKFAFDIGQYIARERAVVVGTAVDRKCTNQLAYVTMRSLVAAYLLHNGYLETATALGGWTSKPASTGQLASGDFDEKSSTIEAGTGYHQKASGTTFANGSLETPVSDLSSPHETFFHLQSDAHQGTEESDYFLVWPEEQDLLLKRRQLCDAIRCGDYLSALTQLEMHFQQLTKQDPSIGFVLRCHHFINLMCNKPTQPQNESHTVTPTRNLASHVALSSDHSFNVTEPHRGYAQKRPKPSDSLESSPEVGPSDYNCTSHSNSVNMHYQLDPDLSPHFLPRGPRSTHEHSPSSCQAPIRLRLSVPSAQSGRPESISECASVPVYPPHYHCHRERSASDNSIPPNLLNLADGGPDQVGNGALSGSHSTQDGRKRQHHITSVLRFPVYDSADIERGPNIVGTTVGLIDLSAFSSDGEPGQLKCPNNGCQCKSPPSSVGSPPTSFGDTTPQSALPLQTMDFQNNGNAVGDPIDCTDPSFVSESLSNGTIPFATSNAPNCNTSCPPATSNPTPCCGQFGVEFDDGLRKPHKSPNEDSRSPCNWSMTDDVLHLVEYGRLLRSTALELLQQNAINPTQIQLLVVSRICFFRCVCLLTISRFAISLLCI